jgi:hypothetical protein
VSKIGHEKSLRVRKSVTPHSAEDDSTGFFPVVWILLGSRRQEDTTMREQFEMLIHALNGMAAQCEEVTRQIDWVMKQIAILHMQIEDKIERTEIVQTEE